MSIPERTLSITPLSMVKSRRQEFLDAEHLIPLGAPTIFSGRGGEGKSTLALDYAAKISNGTMAGKYHGHPRNVLIIQHEDDPGTQLKPRLNAAGANEHNIHLVKVSETVDNISTLDMPYLTRDMPLVRQALEETEAVLILIDPLTSVIEGDVHKVQDVRRALNPLGQLAQEFELGVICIMHVRKGQGSASDKTSGSHAFRDVARSLLIFAHDEETGNRIVTVEKSSYSQTQGSNFAFELVPTDVETDTGEITNVARVNLLGETELSVPDIWNRETDQGATEDRSETETWLRSFLTDRGGKAKVKDIRRAATGDGFVWRTVQRTGTRICTKANEGFQGEWTWQLNAKDDTKNPIDATGDNTDTPDTYDTPVSPLGLIL